MGIRTVILILILSVLAVINHAISIRTQIWDENGRTLPDVIITDGYRHGRSDEQGNIHFETKAPWVSISKIGYEKVDYPASQVPPKIVLKAQPVELPPISVTGRFEHDFVSAADMSGLRIDDFSGSRATDLIASMTTPFSADTPLVGERQTVGLIGNHNRHTLVMLDGVPLNSSGEAFDLSRIDLQSIERIEIIKNNATVYGGTGAIGGIIHFFSRQGIPDEHMQITGGIFNEAGSFGMWKRGGQTGMRSRLLSWQVFWQQVNAANDFKYRLPVESGVDDEFRRENNTRIQRAFAINIGGQSGIFGYNLRVRHDQFRRQLPGPTNFTDIYRHAFLSGSTLHQNLQLRQESGRWKNQMILWQIKDDTLYDNTRAPTPVNIARYRQAHQSNGLKNNLSFQHGWWRQDVFAETNHRRYQNKNLLSPDTSFGKDLRHYAAGTKSAMDLDMGGIVINLAATLRYDHTPDKGYLTHRQEGAILYPWLIDLEWGATRGSSFSLPSFYDLYWKGDTQTVGNPELRPERAEGFQIWMAVQHERTRAKVTYHHNTLRDLIQWRQSYLFGPVWKPLNLGRAEINNWEMELNLQPVRWINLSMLTTFTESRNLVLDGQPRLIYTPDRILTLNSEFIWRNWRWWQKVTHTGKQWTTPDNLIDPLEPWTVIDSGITWQRQFGDLRVSSFFRINNLTDHTYQIYHYVPQPGRNWSAGLSVEYSVGGNAGRHP